MKPSIILPPNHHRALSARLYIIEKHVDEISALLNNSGDSYCYSIKNDLSNESVVTLQSNIREIKQHISKLAEKYNIQKEIKSIHRIIGVKKTLIWEILSDTFSKKLKGYGAFPEEYKIEFDSDIEKLLELTEKIIP